jgi:hypothetical protein
MHKIARWNYFISLVFSVFFVVTAWAVSNYYQAPLVSAADSANNIRGWGYSSNSGWISLNSLNTGACQKCEGGTNNGEACRTVNDCPDPTGSCSQIAVCPAYGLSLVPADNNKGEIKGYAWSSSLGYMCFGSTCAKDNGSATPPITSNELTASYACKGSTCHTTGIDPLLDVQPDKVGLACSTNADCNDVLNSCYDDGNTSCDQATEADVTGWAKINSKDDGWVSLNSLNSGNDPQIKPYGLKILFNQCFDTNGNPTSIETDCPAPKDKYTVLSGWAWHQAGGSDIITPSNPSKTAYGVGWLCFNNEHCTSESEILFPYVYGQGGDVFSQGNIQTMFPPPVGMQNASYLIHVGGSKIGANFRTACTNSTCKDTKLVLNLPSTTTAPGDEDSYNFKLGRFDFNGLATQVGGTTKNAYNFEVVKSFPPVTGGSTSLAGKVYVVDTTYTINDVLTINNGVGTSGAGTIIVQGDLIVNNDIKYETGSVARKQLASVVWFVLGDVKVAANVKEMAGTYIVLGKRARALCKDGSSWGFACPTINLTCPPILGGGICTEYKVCNLQAEQFCADETVCGGTIGSCKPKYLALNIDGDLYDGFGKFDSCNPKEDCSDNSLIVNGSVFARQFKLNRNYVDIVAKGPAENFISGGRLQLNPPPGMEDLSNGLPTFSRR